MISKSESDKLKKNLLDESLLLVSDGSVTDQLEGRMSEEAAGETTPHSIHLPIYPSWKRRSRSLSLSPQPLQNGRYFVAGL